MVLLKRFSVETERLLLRPFNGCDLNALLVIANDYEVASKLALMPYPYTEECACDFLSCVNDMGDTGAIFAVELKETSALIGCAGYGPCSDMVAREDTKFSAPPEAFDALYNLPDLGYWLGKKYWGKGYATEASLALVEHAFTILNLEVLGSAFHKSNPASGRVLEKIGFEIIGEEWQESWGAGALIDTWLLSLSRENWQKRRKKQESE